MHWQLQHLFPAERDLADDEASVDDVFTSNDITKQGPNAVSTPRKAVEEARTSFHMECQLRRASGGRVARTWRKQEEGEMIRGLRTRLGDRLRSQRGGIKRLYEMCCMRT
jgi:hypothetical protein